MAAIRIIDDHVELANIGTNTHAQIDSHIADPSAHHVKYTDTEAVSAVATADDYVKNTGDIIAGEFKVRYKNAQFTIDGSPDSGIQGSLILYGSQSIFRILGYSTTEAYIQTGYTGHNDGRLVFSGLYGNKGDYVQYNFGIIDYMNNVIKDPKNHVASALSGTKKLVEIKIGAQSYYFEVYPTKA